MSLSTAFISPATGERAHGKVAVIGSIDTAPIGVELAFRMAGAVLRHVRDASRPADPAAGRHAGPAAEPSRRIARHQWLHGASRQMPANWRAAAGHRIIGLVYSQAVSGGFLASSLMADRCYALPEAQIRVMNLPAMARITKIPLERLEELSKASPVFAPGVKNYLRMGAVDRLVGGRSVPATGRGAGRAGRGRQPPPMGRGARRPQAGARRGRTGAPCGRLTFIAATTGSVSPDDWRRRLAAPLAG